MNCKQFVISPEWSCHLARARPRGPPSHSHLSAPRRGRVLSIYHRSSMGSACSCNVPQHVPPIVQWCACDNDIVSLIIAQLPLSEWEGVALVSSVWANSVRAKVKECSHVKPVGSHPGMSRDVFSWPTCAALWEGGGLIVSEAWSHRVVLYDSAGRARASFGGAGRTLPSDRTHTLSTHHRYRLHLLPVRIPVIRRWAWAAHLSHRRGSGSNKGHGPCGGFWKPPSADV